MASYLNSNISLGMHQDARMAFKGSVQRVRVKAGELLYKHTHYSLVSPKGTITPWWLSYRGLKEHNDRDLGYVELKMRAKRLNLDPDKYIRAWGNVCLDWNPMGKLLVVELLEDVYGLYGAFSSQPLLSDGMSLRKARDDNDRQERFKKFKEYVGSNPPVAAQIAGLYGHPGGVNHLDDARLGRIHQSLSDEKVVFIGGSKELFQLFIPGLENRKHVREVFFK